MYQMYQTGNSWGQDENGKSCLGCGPQEQFYGCADVAIGNISSIKPLYGNSSSNTVKDENSVTLVRPSADMTTDYQLIRVTTNAPTTTTGTETLSTSARYTQQRLHNMQGSTLMTLFPLPEVTSTAKPKTDVQMEENRSNLGHSVLPTLSHQPIEDDNIVEQRHKAMFAGEQFTMVTYSRHRLSYAPNISHSDLLRLDPEGSVYVVPAWYAIVDQQTKQLNVIEPKLLSGIMARLEANEQRVAYYKPS